MKEKFIFIGNIFKFATNALNRSDYQIYYTRAHQFWVNILYKDHDEYIVSRPVEYSIFCGDIIIFIYKIELGNTEEGLYKKLLELAMVRGGGDIKHFFCDKNVEKEKFQCKGKEHWFFWSCEGGVLLVDISLIFNILLLTCEFLP